MPILPHPSAPPVVLCLAGHDPSGGAGIQADIEAIAAHGCHAATVLTALTEQDTAAVHGVRPQRAVEIEADLRRLLADLPVAAVKIGLLGSVAAIAVIARLLADLQPRPPLVLDPILAAGSGHPFADLAIIEAILAQLLPLATVATPNDLELLALGRLAGAGAALGGAGDGGEVGLADDARARARAEAAAALLAAGCGAILATGGDRATPMVENRLYRPDRAPVVYRWPRLAGRFHGAGCTLASALAARLALGQPLIEAVVGAQAYTDRCLLVAHRPGRGVALPRRVLAGVP
jgi:hydroxymethylpyrimidine/phosphomethylpyrimidine kinase